MAEVRALRPKRTACANCQIKPRGGYALPDADVFLTALLRALAGDSSHRVPEPGQTNIAISLGEVFGAAMDGR